MLDTLSPETKDLPAESYLLRKHREDMECLQEQQSDHVRRVREAAWNALVPPCAIEAHIEPYGVRYRHPTKGWKTIGKRRFRIRGVI